MAFNNTLAELKSIDGEDFKRIGTAPVALRGFVVILACAAVIAAMAQLMVKPQFDKLRMIEAKEQQLRATFDREQAKAANRTAYAEQLEQMKLTFNVMLRQLPNRTDIESLLVDLSQTSVASGLEVQYFKPETEVPKEFYAEYPIRISVTGQYHQFGQFISGLAALPRIVTLSKIDISQTQARPDNRATLNGNPATSLKMDLMATTYRYLEEDE
ncbi:MAG: type 4a pilus biogenesis protein PilO [Granulosicoccus sp.]